MRPSIPGWRIFFMQPPQILLLFREFFYNIFIVINEVTLMFLIKKVGLCNIKTVSV
jgi:hypothetical protein